MIMSTRTVCLAVALAAAAIVPAVANEAGYIEPVPQLGSIVGSAPAARQDRNSMPPMSAAMAQGCAKAMAMHDHGADRNAARAPSANAMPCDGSEAPAASIPNKPVHDHAKFHKNQ
jgi:hypothetical protein